MTHASADLFDHSRFLANTTQQPGIYQMFGGDGAEIRAPMAITVIFGLSLSTLLTLLFIPVLYALVSRDTAVNVDAAEATV